MTMLAQHLQMMQQAAAFGGDPGDLQNSLLASQSLMDPQTYLKFAAFLAAQQSSAAAAQAAGRAPAAPAAPGLPASTALANMKTAQAAQKDGNAYLQALAAMVRSAAGSSSMFA
jgi:hypothetical protein